MSVMSLTTNNVNFRDIIEDGFEGGPLIPEDFKNDAAGFDVIRNNILKSPYVGQIVAHDFKSTLIVVPLMRDTDGQTVTKAIKAILPNNSRISVSVLGFSPFLVELKKEFQNSLLVLLGTWFLGATAFFIYARRFFASLFLAPILSVVLQLALYSFFNTSLHPFVLPVLIVTMILSVTDRMWSELNSSKENMGITPWVASIALIPAMSLYLLQSPLAQQAANLCLTGALALLITHKLFLDTSRFSAMLTSSIIDRRAGFTISTKNFVLGAIADIGTTYHLTCPHWEFWFWSCDFKGKYHVSKSATICQ